MWHILRQSSTAGADFAGSVTELVRPTARSLILATTGAYLLWFLVAAGVGPPLFRWELQLIVLLLAPTCGLALFLTGRNLVAAQIVWQAGLAGALTLAVALYGQPEIAFLYALLPLTAALTLGLPAAVGAQALVLLLLALLQIIPGAPALAPGQISAIALAAAFGGLLGWAASRSLLTAVSWSLASFRQAEEKTAEVQRHRAELARLVKDLDMAYARLERANHALVLARTEAEQAREARNRFALAISHELRAPLNFIIGFSELMVNAPETYAPVGTWPPGLYDDVQEIYRSSTHLMRLINDVLDLGQIDAMRMALSKEWVAAGEIVAEVTAMIRPAFERRGLWLRQEVEPDLPLLFADRTRIRQVLLNLASNSLRFTEQGGVTLRVRCQDDELVFSVEDTGPGIPEADIPKVFEEFRQLETASWRRREGTGLGLPISKRFVELHGGRMWVESAVGQGATFHFSIPVPGRSARQWDAEATPADVNGAYWARLQEQAERTRLLLALSSDPAAGEVMGRLIEDYSVVAVPDTEQARLKAVDLLPSAILLEQGTYGETEVAALLAALPYDLPLIRLSFPGSPGKGEALPEGVVGHLVKPIDRHALVEAVRKAKGNVAPPQADAEGTKRTGECTVLVVDDDPAMQRFVALAFESARRAGEEDETWRLVPATTGADALAAAKQNPPDVILLDLLLPDCSGLDVLAALRAQGCHAPTILITAYDLPQAQAAGAGRSVLQLHMRRPLTRDELARALKGLLAAIRPGVPPAPAAPAPPTDRAA